MNTADSTTLQGIEVARATATPQAPPLEFAANLDVLRSLAVGLVLLDHVLETISARNPAWQFHPYDWGAGRMGVLLFFVHTSLVLNFSMARMRLGGFALVRAFLVRRAFRLYPLSILCVLLVFALRAPTMPFHEDFAWHGWGALLSNLALTMNLTFTQPVLGPLWSLPIEAQMYVVLPFLFLLLGTKRSPRVALVAWIMACLLGWVQPRFSDRLNVLGFAPCFIPGVLAYCSSGRQGWRAPAWLWAPFLLIALCGFAIAQRFVEGGIYNRPLGWVFCLAIGIAIPLFRDSTMRSANAAALHVAQYSYGIYLFHCIALWIGCFVLASLPVAAQWATALAIVVAMSVASYHWLEKPAIDLGARIARKWT